MYCTFLYFVSQDRITELRDHRDITNKRKELKMPVDDETRSKSPVTLRRKRSRSRDRKKTADGKDRYELYTSCQLIDVNIK